MRALLLATAAAATASNESAWRERLGLAGSACPAECPLRHRSIVNIKDFGRAGFADRQFIIEGVTIMAVSLCARKNVVVAASLRSRWLAKFLIFTLVSCG